MPRIKLVEQKEYPFRCRITLQPRDINYAGHLGNDALVSILGTARANTFRLLGLREGDLGDSQTGIIMSDLVVNFKTEAFMFDELEIDTQIGELTRNGFRMFHRVKKGETIVALAEMGITAFNYTVRKVAPVPEVFLEKLAEQGKR